MPAPRVGEPPPTGGPAYGVVPAPEGYGGPEFRGWTEGRRPTQPKPIKGQLTLDVGGPDMMDTLAKVVTGFTMIGLLGGLVHWARPTLRASKIEERNGIWGWTQKVLDSIQAFLDHGVNKIGHEVSKGAAHAAASPARTLDLMALRWEQLIWNLADFVHEMELVTARLVHTKIPEIVRTQTKPLRLKVGRIERVHGHAITQLRGQQAKTKRDLGTNVKPRLKNVETGVKVRLPGRIERVKRDGQRTAQRQKQDHKVILKLLPLLTIAGAAVLVLKALPRLGLGFLRCPNFRTFGPRVCATDPDYLNLALLDALLILGPISVVEFCKGMQAIEGDAVKVMQLGIKEL